MHRPFRAALGGAQFDDEILCCDEHCRGVGRVAAGRLLDAQARRHGSAPRILTTGWEDEGPTWAPNGRVIMFGRTIQGGRGSQIWSIDVSGRNERRVPTPSDASDPAWSPLIQ